MTIKLNEKELSYLSEIIECDYIAKKEYIEEYENDIASDYKKQLKTIKKLYKKLFNSEL